MTHGRNQTRQIILGILMLIVGFFFCRQYLGLVRIPTEGLLQERRRQLDSLRNDLKAARIEAGKRQDAMAELARDAASYWVLDSGSRVMADQVINREFNQIIRKAQLPSPPKISVSRNKLPGLNHLQQVQIRLDHRAISMKEISRLFAETEKYGGRMVWSYCRIEPDHPVHPSNVRFSARIDALVLNPDAAEFLAGGGAQPAQGAAK